MNYLAGDADGQTPLDHDEAAQLRPASITTRGELDVVEQANIVQATRWAFSRARRPNVVFTEPFLRRLHKRMFGDVWRWAGDYRHTSRNLGVDWWLIPQDIARLVGDARYWVDDRTYDADELCVRFHHRLVAIHPFPNGNGRHARLAADILCSSLGGGALSWGRGLDLGPRELRARYIAALQAADAGDPADLIVFARA
jgi:Fic-DOC domain mobile mystery protein B